MQVGTCELETLGICELETFGICELETLTSMFSFRIINYSNYSLPLYYSLNLELEAAYPFGTWFKNL